MTVRRTTAALAAVLAAALLAPCAAARAGGGDASRMTVYDAGIAQFLEERTIDLQPGTNTVEWRSLMPKAYLRTLRVVVDGADVVRQDVTYDGADVQGSKSPVLHLVIDNKGAAGPRRVQVDYLAPGLKWQNDYSLVLEPTTGGAPPTAALLDSWVSVTNSTGADLAAGTVDLVAGDLSLLVGDGDTSDGDFAMQRQVANNVGFYDRSGSTGGSGAEFGSLSAFTRFTLGRDIRMNANAPVNRFPLLQRARVALEERKVFENTYNQETVARGGFTLLPRGLEVRLVAKNTTSIPMPAGQVTIYANAGGVTQIAGQDRVALTPQGQEFTVSQGRSSTLLGTRRVLDRSEVDTGSIIRGKSEKLVTSVEINLTNRGAVAAEAYVRENVEPYGDNKWEVTASSTPGERLAANLLQFRVTVPAGGTTKVTYTVESR